MKYKRTNLRKREAIDVWLPIAMAICGKDLTDRERFIIRISFKLGWDARAIDEKAPKNYR
ncbi:MAG: hypothetical protein WA635_11290 [Gallionella sp.]